MQRFGFRFQVVGAIAATLGLLTLTGLALYGNQINAQTSQSLLEAKDAQLTQKDALLSDVQKDLAAKSDELAKKREEVDKATQELAQKLKELESAQKKIASQQSEISTNSQELSNLRKRPPLFAFNVVSTQLSDAVAKKTAVQQVVKDAYDICRSVYGEPYLLNQVTIEFVDSFSNPNAAAETEISNGPSGLKVTIRLKDFDKTKFNDVNAVVHELLHSFHGLSTLNRMAYEEGITVAATDAIMEKLISSGKIQSFDPLYVRISSSAYASTSLTLPSSDEAFYTSSDVAQMYQIAGYGWLELYRENSDFFKQFNEKIYAQKRDGNEITDSMVKDTIKSIVSRVNGQPTDTWLQTKAFALN